MVIDVTVTVTATATAAVADGPPRPPTADRVLRQPPDAHAESATEHCVSAAHRHAVA